MYISILLLLIGLALLGAAVWLLRRANAQSGASIITPAKNRFFSFWDVTRSHLAPRPKDQNPAGTGKTPDQKPDAEKHGARKHGAHEQRTSAHDGSGSDGQDASGTPGTSETHGSLDDHRDSAGHSKAADHGETARAGKGESAKVVEWQTISSDTVEVAHGSGGGAHPGEGSRAKAVEKREEERSVTALLVSTRRARRQWAAANESEFTREDAALAQKWPASILFAVGTDPTQAVARDIVSGFRQGHEYHVADVGEGTVMAMRRHLASPVRVHYATDDGVPAGMRRSELLDQPPFYAYTTDVRALDRMLDVRVEDGLAALSQVTTGVSWESDWVVLQLRRRLDFSVWEKIFPHLVRLADAAMVLPPVGAMNTPLEMDYANPSRPIQGREISVDTSEDSGAAEEEAQHTKERPGHLRAVPDSPNAASKGKGKGKGKAGSGSAESADANAESESGVADAAPPYAGHEYKEYPDSDKPSISRPAERVEFPSRSTGRSEGKAEDFEASSLGRDTEDIPPLGEDPDHISGSFGTRAQVIRAEIDHEATIFDDELSAISADRRSRRLGDRTKGGRHRAPDARHALPAAIEPVEAEVEIVDAEVVDPDEES